MTSRSALFFTDPRYAGQCAAEVSADRCVVTRRSLVEAASMQKRLTPCRRIAFDTASASYLFASELTTRFSGSEMVPEHNIAARCMVTKDESEIASLRTAASITDKVFTDLLAIIRPGITEQEIAAEIVARHRRYGAEGEAFDVIVASGKNSSLPHARPTSKPVASGDFVTLDLGCVVNGYHSDMTRTVAVGSASREMKHVYAAVLAAQLAAIAAAGAGVTGRKLDSVARTAIARQGYGKYFVHGLGHGIGLEIHEEPRVSKKNSEPLMCGSVITIEPGIYIPGKFGVRIEDDIVLQSGGCDNITRSPKELIIL